MNGNAIKVTRDEMTNWMFTFGYFHNYRYLRSTILEKDADNVYETFCKLRPEQMESVAVMLRTELVVNATMYAADLAAVLLALSKPPKEFIKTISSLHETGSGSIKEFYESLHQQNFDFFWKLLGYDRIDTKKDPDRYNRSCRRFQVDLLRLSKFFLEWYPLLSCYKHGLNIITLQDAKTGKDVLMMGRPDGSFDATFLSPSWYIVYAEIMETTYRIFNRVVEPTAWAFLKHNVEINFKDNTFKVRLESAEPMDRARIDAFSFQATYPWKIWTTDKVDVFY